MYVNIKDSENGIIVAVCDEELIGKVFSDGEKQLDLTSGFYEGQQKSEQEICDLMRNAYILNLVGEKACQLAKNEGLLEDKEIMTVKNVPHAQILLTQ